MTPRGLTRKDAPPPARAPAADAVLTKAVVRAASLLQLTQKEVAGILGVSEATVSRMFADHYRVAPHRAKEWELARLFVRLFRSIDALWGHGEEARTTALVSTASTAGALAGGGASLRVSPLEVIVAPVSAERIRPVFCYRNGGRATGTARNVPGRVGYSTIATSGCAVSSR